MSDERAKVVVIGAGFGGIETAKALRRAPVEVTVIDRQNHHLLPTAALPGRDRGALSGRRGLADSAHSPQAEERDGADGRGPRNR
jgi:2-polyprenyl-6-methoxyphenol hydroxylase-like FAD-dependent oxidoreductase